MSVEMPQDCHKDICTAIRAQRSILPHGTWDNGKFISESDINNEG
jgi:hypothetical protein